MKKTFFLLITPVIILLLASQLHALQPLPECISQGWPSDRSTILPDPALERGVLPNGMRYVIKENSEPEDRVALYLLVAAGALHERESERGVAHFLEHMLFNGTENFRPGELVKFFQSIGMSFGGDTNALTSYDRTVYNILLPDGSKENMSKGLLVMSDYARGALLLKEEVDRERGVILAEKRSRDSALYRADVASKRFKYRGTLLAKRQIIGTDKVLETADSALLRGYYDSWYRPENMVLVIVGDIKSDSVVPLIGSYFGKLSSAEKEITCPDFGSLSHNGQEIYYLHEKAIGATEIAIESIWNAEVKNDSEELQFEELGRLASIMMLQRRLDKLQESDGGIFAKIGYYSSDLLQKIRYSTLTARTSEDMWQAGLQRMNEQLRKALEFGFYEEELSRVKKDILAGLKAAVQTAGSRDSEMIGREIIHQFLDNRVFQSPEQELKRYSAFLDQLSVEDTNRILRSDWVNESRLITVKGTAVVEGDTPEQTIADYYGKVSKQHVKPYTLVDTGAFPYLEEPDAQAAEILHEEKIDEIDAERIVFGNNVSLVLKRTDFEPNRINMVVDVGGGKLSQANPGMAVLAEDVVNDSGTGRLTRTALGEVLAGTTVNVSFSISEETFRWKGRSLNGDTELLFELMHTVLLDPGFREQALAQVKTSLNQMYDRLQNDVQGPLSSSVQRFFAGGDQRIGLPPRSEVLGIELQELKDWLLPLISTESIEIAVVGDFDRDRIIQLSRKYFGTLPKRKQTSSRHSTLTFPKGKSIVEEVTTSVDKSVVIVAWPTAGFWDIHRTRRLHVLADIFRERLRIDIRERLGASYSPSVFSAPSRVYGDYGKLQVQVDVEPGREQEIIDEICSIAEELRSNEISAQELERVKGPFVTSLKDTMRTNRYWLYSVLANSMRYPQQLSWPTSLLPDFQAITTKEIEQLAATYLKRENRATAIVKPVQAGNE